MMNERIKELIEQCSETSTSYFDGRGNVTSTYFNKEKFAELIVRECASIVYNTCYDGDIGAQAILYEFDIDGARSQK